MRSDAEVELQLTPATAGHAWIGWGNSGHVGTRLRVPVCLEDQAWLVFAGGYQVDAPMCLPLVVRAGGQEQQVRIPVGTPCPAS